MTTQKKTTEYYTKTVRVAAIVEFIRNYDRGTVDKRNRELIANAVYRRFK